MSAGLQCLAHQHPKTYRPIITYVKKNPKKSPQRRLDRLVVILAPGRVGHGLGPVPEHDAAHVGHVGRRRALDRRRHRAGSEVPAAGAGLAGGGPDVELRPAGDVLAPGREAGDEAGLADVADTVVVKLNPDEVHQLHRADGDGGTRLFGFQESVFVLCLERRGRGEMASLGTRLGSGNCRDVSQGSNFGSKEGNMDSENTYSGRGHCGAALM